MSGLKRLWRSPSESGFTLVEMVVAITITGLIIGPLATTVIIGFGKLTDTNQRDLNASDIQLTASYFGNDIQSAVTVITPNNGGAFSCGATRPSDGAALTQLIELDYRSDPSSTSSPDLEATYSTYQAPGSTTMTLYRVACSSGSTTSIAIVARSVTSTPAVSCDSTSPCTSATPKRVSVTVTDAGAPPGNVVQTYVLSGSVRKDG